MASLNRGWEGVVGVGGDGGVNRAWVGVVGVEEKLSGEGVEVGRLVGDGGVGKGEIRGRDGGLVGEVAESGV